MTQRIAIYLTSTDTGPLSRDFPDYGVYVRNLLEPQMPGAEFTPFNAAAGDFPEDPTVFDGVILTGSVAYVSDPDPWIATLFDHIRRMDAARTKLLGICFGHQAIAAALGGTVERREITLGAPAVEITKEQDWMTPPASSLRLYAGNFEQVTALPEGMELLGGAPDCPIVLAAKGSHILGLQFHPEFTEDFMLSYVPEVESKIGPEKAAQAIAEIKGGQDSGICAAWAANFLTS